MSIIVHQSTTGTLELNLNSMPAPAKKAGSCSLKQLPDINKGSDVKMFSLFEQKRVRGFWPCYSDEKGTRELTVSVQFSPLTLSDTC